MPVGDGNLPTLHRSLKNVDCLKLDLELLTIADVAELLSISVPSVRRLQQRRSIPFIKIGGSVRFAKDDIKSYLQKRRVEAIDQT